MQNTEKTWSKLLPTLKLSLPEHLKGGLCREASNTVDKGNYCCFRTNI